MLLVKNILVLVTQARNTVDTDGLVLKHQGISSYSVEYAPMHFQFFMG